MKIFTAFYATQTNTLEANISSEYVRNSEAHALEIQENPEQYFSVSRP